MNDDVTSIEVSLPEQLRQFVAERVADRFESVSEYVCELIRADQRRATEEKLEVLLVEGLNSGAPTRVTPEVWDRKRRELIGRHNL